MGFSQQKLFLERDLGEALAVIDWGLDPDCLFDAKAVAVDRNGRRYRTPKEVFNTARRSEACLSTGLI